MEIVVDNRETSLIKKMPFVKIKQLHLGDIQFIMDEKIVCIVERKTMSDLSSSIKDGRSREQKARLLDFTREHCILLIYLIEGEFILSEKSTLMSSIVNKIVRDKIYIIRSKGVDESCDFIKKLQEKLLQFNGNNTLVSNYISTLKPRKKDNLDPKTVFITQLMCIPLISHSIAEAIASGYPNMLHLIQNTEKIHELEFELKTKDKTGQFKKRKVGKAVQKNIITYLNVC